MLILGLNLTQDRTVRLTSLLPGAVLRAHEVETAPGGKPVNVARAALALGGRPTLVANCPGAEGARLAETLAATGLPVVVVPSTGELRTATIVLEASGRTTVINEPGPVVDRSEVAAFLAAYERLLLDLRPHVVVASGSLPPGAPVDLYADVARRAAACGATTVVDATGPVLSAAIQAGPGLVKPNLAEAEAVVRSLTGDVGPAADAEAESVDEQEPDVPERCVAAAEALVAAGAQAALVSGGRHGAALRGDRSSWWFNAPKVAAVNPIGAGDALVAGVVVALERGESLVEAVRHGIASATDSVRRARPAEVDAGAVASLLQAVAEATSAEVRS